MVNSPASLITTRTITDDPVADARLTVDLGAVVSNYRRLSDMASGARCGAAVKANGYGLGAEEISGVLYRAGCRDFFVAQTTEAVALRPILPDARIHILAGPNADDARQIVELGAIPVLNHPGQAAIWRGLGPSALHIDTGINRLGFAPQDWSGIDLNALDVRLVMSHLACADTPDNPMNAQQRDLFRTLTATVSMPLSLANSGGVMLGTDYHFDLVRPGIALYGGNPRPGLESPFQPVAHLDVRVLQIRDLPAGAAIGYGATYRTRRDSRIAILGLGYADGLSRALGSRARLGIDGITTPVIGRVSMDLLAIDITDLPIDRLTAGDFVPVLDAVTTVNDLAAAADTISYEVLTGLGSRFARRYQGA